MDVLNGIFGALFRGLLVLFGGLPVAWSLVLISLLLGFLMLFAFKYIGDPEAMETSKNRMQAHLMEMRLFDREPKVVFVAMGRLFAQNFRFFVATLKPAIVATAPMILLFIQMEHYYGVRPLRPGESTVVTAALTDIEQAQDVRLAGQAVAVETLPVRSAPRGQVSWRIRGEAAGEAVLTLAVGGEPVTKTVTVNAAPSIVSMRRASSAGDVLLYPIESSLPGGPVRWIEVRYPPRSVSLLGLSTHWLVWLVVISVLGAFVIRAAVNAWRPGTF